MNVPPRTLELHVLTPDVWFSDGVVYPNLGWLSSDLLPKLLRWASECRTSEFKSTLSLLPLEKYGLMYQRLKDKYKAMVKVQQRPVVHSLSPCTCTADTPVHHCFSFSGLARGYGP